MTKHSALAAVLLATWTMAACSPAADEAPPVATPSVTLSRTEAAIGTPIDITYSFAVAPAAPPFAEDYVVFVHFINADGELMWTDDHLPPTPTRQWQAGQTVQYQRTIFVPTFPYEGETRIHVGLYSPQSNVRLPLAGEGDGRAYRVGLFQMRVETDNLFVVFKDGWHAPEVAEDGRNEWHWSTQAGTLSFRNPKRDVTVMLLADMPVAAFAEPQQVEVRLGSAVVDTFTLSTGQQQLRRIALTADQFGDAGTVEMTVAPGRTFVPAAVPAMRSGDSRELGVRVLRVYVQPN